MTTSKLLALRIRQLEKREEDIEQASEILCKARCKSKEEFMRRYKHRIQKATYEPGELVLIRNNRYEESLSALKTRDRYIGPYQIVKRTEKGNYILKELDGTLLSETVAAFRVLKYLTRNDLESLIQEEHSQPDEQDLDLSPSEPEEDGE
ncbi:hypothetical protein ONZ45_g14099 [Pleurotus djamor]|nr:hypothetical protein ONZ45_g14099 [Pleurotus djamor]